MAIRAITNIILSPVFSRPTACAGQMRAWPIRGVPRLAQRSKFRQAQMRMPVPRSSFLQQTTMRRTVILAIRGSVCTPQFHPRQLL